MTSDSRLKREAPRREARLGPQGESGGAVGNRPNPSINLRSLIAGWPIAAVLLIAGGYAGAQWWLAVNWWRL